MNMEEQLRSVVDKATVDSELWHKIIHGNNTTEVQTENGKVSTVAKQLKDVRDSIMGGVIDVVSRAEAARDIAIRSQVETDTLKDQTQTICDETLSLRNEAEGFKNQSQNTFNNIATATSTSVTTIQTETSKQIANIGTSGATQVAFAKAEADRAGQIAANMVAQEQTLYQATTILSSSIIRLSDKVVRYKYTANANTTFTLDISACTRSGLDLTFELILVMSTPRTINFASITSSWLGGDTPDLSEEGEHWFAFTSTNGGASWKGSYEGKF